MEIATAAAKFACEVGKFSATRCGDDIVLEFDPPIKPGQERFFKGNIGLTYMKVEEGGTFYKYRVYISNDILGKFVFQDCEGDTYTLHCYGCSKHFVDYNSNKPSINRIRFTPKSITWGFGNISFSA